MIEVLTAIGLCVLLLATAAVCVVILCACIGDITDTTGYTYALVIHTVLLIIVYSAIITNFHYHPENWGYQQISTVQEETK